jgi:ketosteroid isomerase-like protein
MSANNKAIIEKANEAFARNDVEALLALCTENFTWTMVGSAPAVGKAAVREWMTQAPPETPQFSIDTVIADGDYVTCIGDMTMPENGENVPYAYCDVWRLEGGKIAELRAFVIKTTK